MEIVKAVQKLSWRFTECIKNGKPFHVNQNDVDALNSIVTYTDQKQKQQFRQNELFAKLYTKVYCKMIEHYKTDVLDTEVRKQMHKILETPMEIIFQEFTDRMNDLDRNSQLETLGVILKHPSLMNEEERTLQQEKIKEALKTTDIDLLVNPSYDIEFIRDGLEREINNAINLNN